MTKPASLPDILVTAFTCGLTGAISAAILLAYAAMGASGDIVEVKLPGLIVFSLGGCAFCVGLVLAVSHRLRGDRRPGAARAVVGGSAAGSAVLAATMFGVAAGSGWGAVYGVAVGAAVGAAVGLAAVWRARHGGRVIGRTVVSAVLLPVLITAVNVGYVQEPGRRLSVGPFFGVVHRSSVSSWAAWGTILGWAAAGAAVGVGFALLSRLRHPRADPTPTRSLTGGEPASPDHVRAPVGELGAEPIAAPDPARDSGSGTS